MKKIFLIILILFLFSLSVVHGDVDTHNYRMVLSLDDADLSSGVYADLSGSGNYSHVEGATTGVSGVIGEAVQFTTTTDALSTRLYPVPDEGWVSFWIKTTDSSYIIGSADNSFNTNLFIFFCSANYLYLREGTYSNGLRFSKSSSGCSSWSSWTHVAYDWSFTNKSQHLWINGAAVALTNDHTATESAGNYPYTIALGGVNLSGSISATYGFAGYMDEYYFVSGEQMSTALAGELYNSGSGARPSFAPPVAPEPTPVVNITFNTDLITDTGDASTTWTLTGSGTHVTDTSFCQWYGCGNFTVDNGDYINSTLGFALNDGISVSYWIYVEQNNAGTDYYWGLEADGNSANFKGESENDFGLNTFYNGDTGQVNQAIGSSYTSVPGTWEHYCTIYNATEGRLLQYKDGVLRQNTSEPAGALNYSIGEAFTIADGRYGDMVGYIDEFLMYNTSIDDSECTRLYNKQRLGTPPEIDVYWKDISIPKDYDFTNAQNNLSFTQRDVNFTIANAGTNSSGNFMYTVYRDISLICSDTISIGPMSETQVSCSWTPSTEGIDTWIFTATITDDVTENNVIRENYIYKNRPYMFFTRDDLTDTLNPYCQNSANKIAYASCQFFDGFLSEDFTPTWTASNIDPRAKKGAENAWGCMYNGWNRSSTQCQRALNHLIGWTHNISADTYTNVQSIPELMYVAMTYDWIFPILNETEYELITNGSYAICQNITNLDNTRPDLDVDDDINGGNGLGFGSGMDLFCAGMAGEYAPNTFLIQRKPDNYWGLSIPSEWRDRQERYLTGYKDSDWAKYQEGWEYQFYSQGSRLLDTFAFYKENPLITSHLSSYNETFCAMARSLVTDMLDDSYNGDTLRNDEANYWRGVQRGDSSSYTDPGSNSLKYWGVASYYAYLCSDTRTKNALLYLRNEANNQTAYSLTDTFMYYTAFSSSTNVTPEASFPKTIFDNSNDIFTIRTNYTYVNDTVIQVDGGDERGGGHSQAQGFYLYALGEPFLDYEQIPTDYFGNDDVRSEEWKNAISFENQTVTQAGSRNTYSDTLGNAVMNQYYGMSDATPASIANDYPNFRTMPLNLTGDVSGYIGTEDAGFAGVRKVMPYAPSGNVQEDFIKFGDMLLRQVIIENSNSSEIYDNRINILDEFNMTGTSENITFSRLGKNLDINVTYSNQTVRQDGDNSSFKYCFSKTDCTGNNLGLGEYRRNYLYVANNDWTGIESYHWYYDGAAQTVTPLGTVDRGAQIGNKVTLFDTNGNGNVEYASYNATGWGLVYDATANIIGAFNTTSIGVVTNQFSSNKTVSVYIDRSNESIEVTINTWRRKTYIDEPDSVEVSVETSALANNGTFTVKKNNVTSIPTTRTGTVVTFNVSTEINSDYYVITADIDVSGDSCSPDGTSDHTFLCSDNCVLSDTIDFTGNNVVISGTGSLHGLHYIKNAVSIKIKGTDVSNICRVKS